MNKDIIRIDMNLSICRYSVFEDISYFDGTFWLSNRKH